MSDETTTVPTQEVTAPKLDALKTQMLQKISDIDFREFFAKAAKCSDSNSRILLIVKPEAYEKIAETPFLSEEYFEYLVETLRDKIYDNMELVVRMPVSDKGDEGDLDTITLGDELDMGDLDMGDLDDMDLEDWDGVDGFNEEDETKQLTFLCARKLKVLLIVENKDDYLCIRQWALARVEDLKEKVKMLAFDKDGIRELFEEEYHKVLKKSMEQKKSVVTLGIDKDSKEFEEFSEAMMELKKNISPNESEVDSFIDFMLLDEELFVKDGVFNLKSFSTIPSFIIKNFGPLTERIKNSIEHKDEAFKAQIETIKKTITGLDNDKDLSFFILNEMVKDISFVIVKKLYLSNNVVQEHINQTLSEFEDVMLILINPADANITSLRLAIKDMFIPYLNAGWASIGSLDA